MPDRNGLVKFRKLNQALCMLGTAVPVDTFEALVRSWWGKLLQLARSEEGVVLPGAPYAGKVPPELAAGALLQAYREFRPHWPATIEPDAVITPLVGSMIIGANGDAPLVSSLANALLKAQR